MEKGTSENFPADNGVQIYAKEIHNETILKGRARFYRYIKVRRFFMEIKEISAKVRRVLAKISSCCNDPILSWIGRFCESG